MPDWSQLIPVRSTEEIVEAVAEHLRDAGSKLTNWSRGGRLRMWTEAVAQPLADLYAKLFKIIPQGFPHKASGAWLDAHAAAYGDTRLAAVKARWLVAFLREDGNPGNITIPAHARVATAPGPTGDRVVFRPLEQAVMPDGEERLEVECEAESAGQEGNVGTETIAELLTPIAGVAGVVNDNPSGLLVEGAAAERDEALQARLVGKWGALGWGSNRAAYEAWALGVPGVGSVWIDDDHPRGQGTVDVYVMGVAGAPTSALLDAVDAVVQERRSLTADVQVLAPAVVPVSVVVQLWLAPGEGSLLEAEAAARARLEWYFRVGAPVASVTPLGVAEDVRPGRLVHLCLGAADVYDAEIEAPNAVVPVGPGEIASLESLSIQAAFLEEL